MIRETTVNEYSDKLYSNAPAPGGGGAAALAGALAACLGGMVANFTAGRKKYADYEDQTQAVLRETARLKERLLDLADADEEVFLPLSKAYGLPRETAEEQAERDRVMEACLADACDVPLSVMEAVLGVSENLSALIGKSNRMVLSDIGVGLQFAHAAMESASLNVFINTRSMKNEQGAKAREARCASLLEREKAIFEKCYPQIAEALKR